MCFPATSGYSFFHFFSFAFFLGLTVSFIHFSFSSSFSFSMLTLRPDPKSPDPLLKFAPARTAAAQFIASGDCAFFKTFIFNKKYDMFVAFCVSGLQNLHHGSLEIFILGMSWQLSKSISKLISINTSVNIVPTNSDMYISYIHHHHPSCMNIDFTP